MYKILIIILAAIICFIPATAFAEAVSVSSNDLIDKAKEYDGKEVTYTGEVIGDIMARGEYTWINVSDGNNAIGIWVKTSDMKNIDIAGRYSSHGDIIKVNGIFQRACAEHGGDFDIHAKATEMVQKGCSVKHESSVVMVIFAFTLSAAALIVIALVFRRIRVKMSNTKL